MKKIIFFDNWLSGQLLFRGDILKHFQSKGFEIIIIAPPTKDKLYKIPKGIKFIPLDFNRTSTSICGDIKLLIGIYKILKKERPEFVFNYTIKPNIYGAIASKLLGIRNADMIAGLGYTFISNSFSAKIAKFLYKIGLSCTDKLMLLNKHDVEKVIELNLCKKEKIVWLEGGEGVNLDSYPYFNNESKNSIFLFVGRLIEDKGYNVFAEAAGIIKKRYPETKFWILGGFDLKYPRAISKETIKKDEKDKGIEYLGLTNKMIDYYRKPGIVICIPSFYSEGLNRSLMEGCATGKPIITCDNQGCRETCNNGINGYIVPPCDVNALVEAMEKYILLSTQEKKEFSIESRKLAEERFDIKEVIKVYEDILNYE